MHFMHPFFSGSQREIYVNAIVLAGFIETFMPQNISDHLSIQGFVVLFFSSLSFVCCWSLLAFQIAVIMSSLKSLAIF